MRRGGKIGQEVHEAIRASGQTPLEIVGGVNTHLYKNYSQSPVHFAYIALFKAAHKVRHF